MFRSQREKAQEYEDLPQEAEGPKAQVRPEPSEAALGQEARSASVRLGKPAALTAEAAEFRSSVRMANRGDVEAQIEAQLLAKLTPEAARLTQQMARDLAAKAVLQHRMMRQWARDRQGAFMADNGAELAQTTPGWSWAVEESDASTDQALETSIDIVRTEAGTGRKVRNVGIVVQTALVREGRMVQYQTRAMAAPDGVLMDVTAPFTCGAVIG